MRLYIKPIKPMKVCEPKQKSTDCDDNEGDNLEKKQVVEVKEESGTMNRKDAVMRILMRSRLR